MECLLRKSSPSLCFSVNMDLGSSCAQPIPVNQAKLVQCRAEPGPFESNIAPYSWRHSIEHGIPFQFGLVLSIASRQPQSGKGGVSPHKKCRPEMYHEVSQEGQRLGGRKVHEHG